MRIQAAALCVLFELAALPCLAQDSDGLVVTNPVTGSPQLDVVSEEDEIATARRVWSVVRDRNEAYGHEIDRPGERLARTRRVFERLVGVAHRQQLPWDVHVIESPEVNAATPGGGIVWIFGGAFGGLIDPESDDNQLAAILSHEIAHVTLLHVRSRQMQLGLAGMIDRGRSDPYFRAAFTTAQEAEADRIGVLYMALAGFNPMSAHVLWARAHEKRGSSAAAANFRHSHPLNAERVAITYDAAMNVSQYRIPGERNPNWEAILADNSLFKRQEIPEDATGARALAAALEAYRTRESTREEQHDRARAAKTLRHLQLRRAFEAPTADGRVGVFLEIYNRGPRKVKGVAFAVDYLRGQQVVASDTTCGGPVRIKPNTTGVVGCYKKQVPGTSTWRVRVIDIQID